MRVVAVGIGGVFGALARYAVGVYLNDRGMLPWGTLAVNLLGCFLLAFFLTMALQRFSGDSYFVLAISTGFIGSLTTFSTLSVESIALFHSWPAAAIAYLGLTLICGYILTWLGWLSGRYTIGTRFGQKWVWFAAEGKND